MDRSFRALQVFYILPFAKPLNGLCTEICVINQMGLRNVPSVAPSYRKHFISNPTILSSVSKELIF